MLEVPAGLPWRRGWLLKTLPNLLPDCTVNETCLSSGSSRGDDV